MDVRPGRWYAADTCSGTARGEAGQGGVAKVSLDMASVLGHLPSLWSAEQPALYLAVIELSSTDDSGTEASVYESSQVGFRQTQVTGGQLIHNGSPVMMRGVNRHEFDPRRGKVITEEHMIRDILLMKRSNFNAMRCSHYPNNIRWYELCNLYGLYVVEEANLETHGFDPTFTDNAMNPACSPAWSAAMMDRGIRMYERTKNQPCIALWSLGNESGIGPIHDALAAWLRAKDPSRPIHYEGGGSRSRATDVICPMYPRTAQLESLLKLMAQGEEHRPLLLCEYAHSMGNSTGNLDAYWDLFESSPGCAGGFIWDWADQCLVRRITTMTTSTSGEGQQGQAEYWAIGGDFGDTPNDAQFCANGLVFPDRTPHPCLEEARHVMAPIKIAWPSERTATPTTGGVSSTPSLPVTPLSTLVVTLTSGYDTITTEHMRLQWRLVGDGTPLPLPIQASSAQGLPTLAPSSQIFALKPSTEDGLRQENGDAPGSASVQQFFAAVYTEQHPRRLLPAAAAGGSEAEGVQDGGSGAVQGGQWRDVPSPVVAPRGRASVELPIAWGQVETVLQEVQATDCWLEVRALLSQGTSWAPAGHLITAQQLPLPAPAVPAPSSPSAAALPPLVTKLMAQVAHKEQTPSIAGGVLTVKRVPGASGASGHVLISGPSGVCVELCAATGVMHGLSQGGTQLMQGPLLPCLFRACTDNDRGGAGGGSYARRWAVAGLDRLEVVTGSAGLGISEEPSGQVVVARARYDLRPRALAPDEIGLAVAGAGVGEVGGAHWFANQEPEAVVNMAETATGDAAQAAAALAPGAIGQAAMHEQLQADSATPPDEPPDGTTADTAEQQGSKEPEAAGDGGMEGVEGGPGVEEGVVHVGVTYRIHVTGLVDTEWEVDIRGALPAPLRPGLTKSVPRVGVGAALHPGLDQVTWYGRGPHECYPDRQLSAQTGLYQSTVQGMHVPYVFPQENGGRTGVQWVLLRPNPQAPPSTAPSVGLAAFPTHGSPAMQLNVSPYSISQLHAAHHEYELHGVAEAAPHGSTCSETATGERSGTTLPSAGPKAGEEAATHLVLDHVHMGVGGDDSWSPSVHAQYLIPPAIYRFSVGLMPVQSAS